jgi:hypothetical protein
MVAKRAWIGMVLSAAASAQVFVVDAGNGPGTHYTDLPPAVAAVPDGATLRVRAGSYSPFTLQNKGLRVVGEGTVKLDRTAGGIAIGPTAPSQVVLVRNVELPFATTRVTDARGAVVFELCRRHPLFLLSGVTDLEVVRATNLQVHECVLGLAGLSGSGSRVGAISATDSTLQVSRSQIVGIPGTPAFGAMRGTDGHPALGLLRSRCVVVDSAMQGGRGGMGCRSCGIGCWADGGAGGTAVLAVDSTLVLLGATLTGGTGGAHGCCTQVGSCSCGGNGGPGMHLSGSTVAQLGGTIAGGPAGLEGPTCNSRPGAAVQDNGGNQLVQDPLARPPSATVTGTQARGQNVSFTVLAPNGSLALLALSYRGDLLPLDAFGVWGSLLATPALTVGPTLVTANDRVALPVTLPNDLPLGEVYFGQFVTLTNQRLHVSNAFPMLATN